jgi:hypothetical protein
MEFRDSKVGGVGLEGKKPRVAPILIGRTSTTAYPAIPEGLATIDEEVEAGV